MREAKYPVFLRFVSLSIALHLLSQCGKSHLSPHCPSKGITSEVVVDPSDASQAVRCCLLIDLLWCMFLCRVCLRCTLYCTLLIRGCLHITTYCHRSHLLDFLSGGCELVVCSSLLVQSTSSLMWLPAPVRPIHRHKNGSSLLVASLCPYLVVCH